MSWRCKKCGCEYFNIDCEATYHQAELDEYENIDSYKLVDKEMLQYVCFECGNSSEDLENVAEWSEE
jgi:hypothetical protein